MGKMHEDQYAEKDEDGKGNEMDGLVKAFEPIEASQPLAVLLLRGAVRPLPDSQPGPDIQEKGHYRHDSTCDTGDDQ